MIDPKLESLSLSQQCALLSINRSSHYYQARFDKTKLAIKGKIVDIVVQV